MPALRNVVRRPHTSAAKLGPWITARSRRGRLRGPNLHLRGAKGGSRSGDRARRPSNFTGRSRRRLGRSRDFNPRRKSIDLPLEFLTKPGAALLQRHPHDDIESNPPGNHNRDSKHKSLSAHHIGIRPCFFGGRSSRFACKASKARARYFLVSEGSMMSSTSLRPADTYGLEKVLR
jgi:hypothetical protein